MTDEPISPIPSPDIEEAPLPASITILENEWKRLEEEANSSKDKYLRLLAEGENTRKRMQKDRQDAVQQAIHTTLLDFLGPIDQLEKALGYSDHMSPDVKNWALGFQMILNEFKNILSRYGVEAMKTIGEPFDPYSHEAIEVIKTNQYPPNTIIEESRKGYRRGSYILRAAGVKVAAPLVEDKIDQKPLESSN